MSFGFVVFSSAGRDSKDASRGPFGPARRGREHLVDLES